MRIRIRAPKMMRIHADTDLQHWCQVCVQTILDYKVKRVYLFTLQQIRFHPKETPPNVRQLIARSSTLIILVTSIRKDLSDKAEFS